MSTKVTEMVATLTGDVDNAVAELKRVRSELEALGPAAQQSTQKGGRGVGELEKYTEKAAKGVAALTQAFYAMEAQGSAKVLALGGAISNFADILGPQGKVVSGIAIVITSFAALFLQAQERSREAAESIIGDIRRMASAGDVAGLAKRQQSLFSGNELYDDPNEGKNESLKARADAIRRGGLLVVRKEIAELEAVLKKLPPALDAGGAAMEAFNRRRAAAEENAGTLRNVERALSQEYAETTKRLNGVTAAAVSRDATLNKQEGLEKAAAAAEKATEAEKRLAKQIADLADPIARAAEDVSDAVAKRLEQFQKQSTFVDDLKRDSKESAERLIEEATAASKGAKAYKEYTEARDREAAGNAAQQDAIAAAQKLGIKLTTEQKAEIKSAAMHAFDMRQQIDAAKEGWKQMASDPVAVQMLQAAEHAGTLALHIADVAAQATSIATSLGKSGEHIARVAGIIGPLMGGVGSIQSAIAADSPFNIGGSAFLRSVKGDNGAASQAKAIAGSFQVIGAVTQVADALDLFGTRAKQRAEEMREAARQFGAALEDFVAAANPQTGAAEAIRSAQRQARELASQAAAAGGMKLNVDDRSLDSARLRELRDEITGAIAAIGGLSEKGRKQLATVASGFDELARSLEEVEAAAREQVRENIKDLGVRRLIAAGMPEAAEQLRTQRELEKELRAARKDTTDVGREYLDALEDIIAAETMAAAAARHRAGVMQRVEDDNTFLGGDANQRLQRSVGAMVQLFDKSIWSAFDGVDFSSEEGLSAARKIVAGIYQSMTADGVIDEQERQVLDFLKGFVGDIDGALSSLPDVLDPLAAKLERFNDRVRLFGLSAAEQFEQLRTIFADAPFASGLVGDINTGAGRENLKATIEAQIAALLSNDTLDAEQQVYLDALEQFLGVINSAIAEAAAQVAEQAAQARADRDGRRVWAANRIELFGLEGGEALVAQMQSFGAVFTELSKEFDTSSAAGLDAARSHLRAIYDSLVGMTDDEVMQRFGMTRDEVVSAILATNNGLGGLVASLQQTEEAAQAAARATQDFTDQVIDDYLRSSGRDREADLRAAQKKRDDALARAEELQLSAAIIAQINDTYRNEVGRIESRYAVATQDVQQAAASNGGGSGGSASAGRPLSDSEAIVRPRTRSTTVVGDFMTASELTAQSMAGLLSDIRYNTGREGELASLLRALGPAPSLAALSFPAFPTRTMGSSEGAVIIGPITVHIGALSPEGKTPTVAARELVDLVVRQLGERAVTDVKFRGSAKYRGVR
ncbi:hypothetical protein GAU_2260 [Gemmatimonas aurantiaca T-27]|uniref:Uncharacterized protein n=2 Tax=Gemmatimonas aurantiaca TaxID=173480 RepID=C1AAP6_GEMAT|nr:hypothetical protein [Gemmatimonas aurantiaca]BAH39302.1 hypothetical protein GAU_2260 [Gemmatimonas aurantiaca T-27]